MKPLLAVLIVMIVALPASACPTCGKAQRLIPGTDGASTIESSNGASAFKASTYLLLGGVMSAGACMFWMIRSSVKASSSRGPE